MAFVFQQGFCDSSTLTINSVNSCDICKCGFLDLKCSGKSLIVKSLPDFVREIEISDAKEGGVVFERGAIRVRDESSVFKVVVSKASIVEFREKSTTILVANGSVNVNLREIAHLKMKRRSVSSSSGNFELFVSQSVRVDIEGQAFDIMNKVVMDNIGKLNLDSGAFKPNAPLFMHQPFTKIILSNVRDLPSLPMEAFSSAHSISFYSSSIGEIEPSSFSGLSVYNITFESSSIERIHTSAFPEKSAVQNLAFVNCTITSVSENAVTSGISELKILNTTLSSISKEAFKTPVVKVVIRYCVFKTLVKRSFVFKSWDQVTIDSNLFNFLGEYSFLGISEPNSPSDFQFTDNQIRSANQNALKIDSTTGVLTGNGINQTSGNTFMSKKCECNIDHWLMMVTGEENPKDPSVWTIALLETSRCKVPDFDRGCFENQKEILFSAYSYKMCSSLQNDQDCSYESPINIILEQIEVNTNKGILLVVLMFVLTSSLIIGIITLLRWIVYTCQTRKYRRSKNDADWNFTKIEERQNLKENDVIQEEAIELEESPSPTQHYESLALTANTEITSSNDTPPNTTDKNNIKETEESEPLLGVKLPEHASSGKPPTQTTFYDEMICLLQEKLEDPDNYATVVDDKEEQQKMTNNATLYMDPMNVKP